MSEQDWDLLSSYAGLLTLATFSIYAGSHGSLKAPRKSKGASKDGAESDDEDDEEIPDRVSSTDAYLFPVIGSCALLGLYLIVKFLGTEWINWLLGIYFTVAGIGSVWKCSISLAKRAVGPERWKSYDKVSVLVTKGPWEMLSASLHTPSLVLLPFSFIPSLLYVFLPGQKRSAFLTDVLALSFSHTALSVLKLDSFKTGCIMLSGLFMYDIWWVFGTEVMVKVATSLDIPIKILWPKSVLFSTARGFTMLGLGDIIIPGMFVSLALRYDLSRTDHKDPRRPFASPYFASAVTAYAFGLVTTMFVMHTFGAAQPALLYLSPACILSFFLTGLVQGDLKKALEWSDEPENPPKEKESDKLLNDQVQDEKTEESSRDTSTVSKNTTSKARTFQENVQRRDKKVETLEVPHMDTDADGTGDDDDEDANASGSAASPRKNRRRGKKRRVVKAD